MQCSVVVARPPAMDAFCFQSVRTPWAKSMRRPAGAALQGGQGAWVGWMAGWLGGWTEGWTASEWNATRKGSALINQLQSELRRRPEAPSRGAKPRRRWIPHGAYQAHDHETLNPGIPVHDWDPPMACTEPTAQHPRRIGSASGARLEVLRFGINKVQH